MKVISLLLFLLFCIYFAYGDTINKSIVLDDLMNPRYLLADSNQLIISDYPNVFIYSTDNYRLLKRIGRQGPGPGDVYIIQENMNIKERGMVLSVCPDKIAVSHTERISVFNRDGAFLSEKRLPGGINAKYYLRCDGRFIGFIPKKGKLAGSIFNHQLEIQKEIISCPYWFDLSRKTGADFFDRASDTLFIQQYENELYIARGDSPQIHIDVYNVNGEKSRSIISNFERPLIPQDFIDEIHRHFKLKFRDRAVYAIKSLNLPKRFPAIRDFQINDGKIYVITFTKESGKTLVYVFDCQGKQLGIRKLVIKEKHPEQLYPFAFYKEKFYQIEEDGLNEKWFLTVQHATMLSL